ncbi:MAG: hypothetical protein EOM26_07615 [Alphaproteobacteria bacterium]|nr:hypothetical protein [Alphaproteobacteria bacterium]
MAGNSEKSTEATKRETRRKPNGGGAPARRKSSAGNPSYAGYEYQIGVTVWVGLDLILAKGVTEALTIEPRSHEDIEAAVHDPDRASLGLSTEGSYFELSIQAKSRSTEPWTTSALADVLTGKQDDGEASNTFSRERPLAMLAADPQRRYVFVTNESLQGTLRAHAGESLLDFPEVDTLPPHARKGFDATAQASIAPRLLLCSGVTVEILGARIGRLLTDHGHVPIPNQEACVGDLRAAVRDRITGFANGQWTKADLLAVLVQHGGAALPTRAMDHYVRPRSYDAIRRSLEDRHAVVIAGPSGTGKTLTADIIELELQQGTPPFDVVSEQDGPGHVRSQMTRTDPILFHLRDPWGGNRLTPGADRWSDELPKLLRSAGAGRKFLITSRSDVLSSAGHKLVDELAPYIVKIEIEDYGDERLGDIYDGMSGDLSGHALDLARSHRIKALNTLTRPYEIDRFLMALSRQDPSQPRKIDDILEESQIDAISRVVADQITAWGNDGVASAAIVWAILSSRGAVASDVLPRLVRRLRTIDPTLRPDVDSLVDFLVAGRNLRQDGGALAFYHPRVEDGLSMAIQHRRSETEYVLSKLADALAAWDGSGADWGIETVSGILRAVAKLDRVELDLADATHAQLDAYLEGAAFGAKGHYDVERTLEDLARYGSAAHAPSRLARILITGKPAEPHTSGFHMLKAWRLPAVEPAEMIALRNDPRTQPMLERFVREVLPFTNTGYHGDIVMLLARLGSDLPRIFSDALEAILELGGPSHNVYTIIAGVLSADLPDYDGIIGRLVAADIAFDAWMDEYRAEYRSAEEHEIDAHLADHIIEEPGERHYNIHGAMKELVRLRWEHEGADWIQCHPYRQRIARALGELLSEGKLKPEPSARELRVLLSCADGSARDYAWWTARKYWDPSLNDLLETELARTDFGDGELGKTLVEIADTTAGTWREAVAILARVAESASPARRLELIRDVMAAEFGTDSIGNTGGAVRLERAKELANTFPSPESELGHALAAALADGDVVEIGTSLSEPARCLISQILPMALPSIAGPLVCLGATVGVDPVGAAERLLSTDEFRDGELAVLSLVIYNSAAASVTLRGSLGHGRYRVRRAALLALVDKADFDDRAVLVAAADDRSADVRLAWAELMRNHRWPEAVDSLVQLLSDRRNFSNDHGFGSSWSDFCVARAAAKALGAYDTLPEPALDALLTAAGNFGYADPFVVCAALSALADKEDDGILPALIAGLLSPPLPGAPEHRPIAQAASWAVFDRSRAGKLTLGDPILARLACDDSAEVAGPLLMAFGVVGGLERDALLSSLDAAGRTTRSDLLMVASAAMNNLPDRGASQVHQALAKLAERRHIEALDRVEKETLEAWSLSLDTETDVQVCAVWIASEFFNLPVRELKAEPRAFQLPNRIPVLTMRSFSQAREEFSGCDDG